jgi:hypothetical protein
VSMLAGLMAGTVAAVLVALLVLLGVAARRQSERAEVRLDYRFGVPITDEVDVVAAYAASVCAAAERAQQEADLAQYRADQAAADRDMAELRYRLARRRAQSAGEPHQLVQRAALDAYQRGQLSVTELNEIWRHTHAPAEPGGSAPAVPLAWEPPVRASQQRYEQAEAEAARTGQEAGLKAAAASLLAAEAQAAEALLSATRRSASMGLVGLLRASWA